MNYFEFKIGDFVYLKNYEHETFEVVGIRKKELELVGDYSAMNGLKQVCWIPIENVDELHPRKKKFYNKAGEICTHPRTNRNGGGEYCLSCDATW